MATLKFLIEEHGADPNVGNTSGKCRTRCFILRGPTHTHTHTTHRRNAPMVDSPHTTGVVPLLWAVDGRNMAATLYLVDSAGADVNAMSPISGTPLFAAINDYSYVDFLCSRGADVNAQNADGLTALHRAGTD